MIKSIGYSNKEVIGNILKLYIPGGCFELDPTYSTGAFYKGLPHPFWIGDLNPSKPIVNQCDSTDLQFNSESIDSIMFDPPFCFGIHGKTKNNISAKRFTMFDTFSGLCIMYQDSLKEFYRILKKKGILVFKCQDYTDSKTTMTHCLIYNWALGVGFYAKDLFILINENRIWSPKLKQRHARKCHSYFYIFQK